MIQVSNSLNGRAVTWTNGDKEASRGIVRDALVVIQQEQRAVSGIVASMPAWILLVEVLKPPRFAGTLAMLSVSDPSFGIEPQE